jgi:multiple sugar transport system substrate-binding protein
MTAPVTLRGMAWDHPRGRDPLVAISTDWSRERSVAVHWDARPLKSFEDQPLEELATRYDLVLIDHPFAETAAASGLIRPVDAWVAPAYLADQAANSVGASFDSYAWDGAQWALAIDAACQVAAFRPDLWDYEQLPRTWREVAELARGLAHGTRRVALPLNPNHAYCAFLSVGVATGGPDFWPVGTTPDHDAGIAALEFLRRLAADLHPCSRAADPIVISDHMTRSNEILYVPLMFGYSSYARAGFRPHAIRFADAPCGSDGHTGSVLGGVGIALSARSREPEWAADLARRIASPDVQAGLYVDSGGQPGHAAAWAAPAANAQVDDFFVNTRRTIDAAFVRPTVTGHRRFQELAGETIHAALFDGLGDGACLAELEDLVARHLAGWRRGTARRKCA